MIKFLFKKRLNIPLPVRVLMQIIMLITAIFLFVPQHYNTPKDIQVYVKEIQLMSKGNLGNKKINIGFIQEDSSTMARCNYLTNEISINKKYWNTLPNWDRIMLVAHELIHCECRISHNNETTFAGCPASIMYPSDGGQFCNNINRNRYIKEMQTIRCN